MFHINKPKCTEIKRKELKNVNVEKNLIFLDCSCKKKSVFCSLIVRSYCRCE